MAKAEIQSQPRAPRRAAGMTPRRTALHNAEIAAALDEVADILEIENANVFRVRAYRNASRIVSSFPEEIAGLLDRGGTLKGMRGIGADLAGKIEDLALTGSTQILRQLRTELPPALTQLLRLPNLGPKRVDVLHKKLGVETLDQLRDALENDRVAALPRFGKKLADKLARAIDAAGAAPIRVKRAVAAQYAEPLVLWLAGLPGVEAAIVAGSYRRARETVGDLDLLVTAKDTKAVIEAFGRYPEIVRVTARGMTRATGLLRSGLQVDVRAVPPESYGAALVYFTGSKAHNIAIRAIARDRGLKINEYGVFRGNQRIAGRTEAEVYAAIGLRVIDPELREHQGEIEAARAGTLPRLIDVRDIRGDLHTHTSATDGRNTLAEMVNAARSRNYEYVAITDHSRHLAVARGFDPARLSKQLREIDRLNRAGAGIRILKGIELDILEDGRLDLPDEILAELDLVVAAVHYALDLSRAEQTKRVLRALENPHVTILAHPSGRLINERAPSDLDIDQILCKAKEVGCFIELNAQPDRLDLVDSQCRRAKELGVLVSIATDAHAAVELDFMKHGIGQARRAWLEMENVLNTRSYAELAPLLARRRPR